MRKGMIWRVVYAILAAGLALGLVQMVEAAGSFSSLTKWAWSTNAGWINLGPAHGGVTVCADHLEGYAWGENIGWIRLGTISGCAAHTYSNASTADYGVNKSPSGVLSGYAWSTNAGWIKFDPTFGGARLNPTSGAFDGYVWGENIGWIRFKGSIFLPVVRR